MYIYKYICIQLQCSSYRIFDGHPDKVDEDDYEPEVDEMAESLAEFQSLRPEGVDASIVVEDSQPVLPEVEGPVVASGENGGETMPSVGATSSIGGETIPAVGATSSGGGETMPSVGATSSSGGETMPSTVGATSSNGGETMPSRVGATSSNGGETMRETMPCRVGPASSGGETMPSRSELASSETMPCRVEAAPSRGETTGGGTTSGGDQVTSQVLMPSCILLMFRRLICLFCEYV